MRNLTTALIAACFAVAGLAPSSAATADGLQPFLREHCFKCHGPDKQKGDVRLDTLAPPADAKMHEMWKTVLEKITLGEMPPEEEPRPPRLEREHAIAALETALGGSGGFSAKDKLLLPGMGNYVDHATLFTEPAVRRAASPARLWRISPHIFKDFVNGLAAKPVLQAKRNQGGNGLHPALPFMTPAHTFRDAALPHAFEEATTELLVDIAWRVAGLQLAAKQGPAAFKVAQAAAPPGEAEYRAVIAAQFGLALLRDPEPAEVKNLTALALRTAADASPQEALQTVLSAVLLTPEAVFRHEIGQGKPDEHGRVPLSSREIGYALNYALRDEPPDARLRGAMGADRLATAATVHAEAARLVNLPLAAAPRVLRFFQEFFEYTRAPEVFKDALETKHYFPPQLVDDADRFVLHILAEDRDILARLLTDEQYFVFANGLPNRAPPEARARKTYLPIFSLPSDWNWTAQQPVKLPAPRAGLLMHPAWLLAFSDNEKNQAIQRGQWIRTHLLGGTVPDVPIGVNAQLPTDPLLTLREKMKVTRAEYCWRCHQRMDLLGLPLEQFDDFGRHRTQELDRPVVTTGEITIGDPQLDGAVTDPFDYMRRLAASARVRQVFVRHAFRYWLGRNETADDAPTLIDADRAYVAGGGSMKALIASLLTSDSFRYRRPPPAKPALASAPP